MLLLFTIVVVSIVMVLGKQSLFEAISLSGFHRGRLAGLAEEIFHGQAHDEWHNLPRQGEWPKRQYHIFYVIPDTLDPRGATVQDTGALRGPQGPTIWTLGRLGIEPSTTPTHTAPSQQIGTNKHLIAGYPELIWDVVWVDQDRLKDLVIPDYAPSKARLRSVEASMSPPGLSNMVVFVLASVGYLA